MKKPFLFFIFSLLCVVTSAQKVYFAYFQSEDQVPFYVKFADKVFTSGNSGFIVIPNLKDTTYRFYVGFSSNPGGEQKYNIAIDGADKGLVLKTQQDRQVLMDLQNAAEVKPEGEETKVVAYETKTDRFSTLLSKAAEDPSLLKVPVKKEEPKKEETAKAEPSKETAKAEEKAVEVTKTEVPATPVETAVLKPDSVAAKPAETVAIEEKKPETTELKQTPVEKPVETTPAAVAGEEFKRSTISRYSETSTTEGFGLVYFDNVNGAVDTIRMIIPNNKVALAQGEAAKKDDSFFLDEQKLQKKLEDDKKAEAAKDQVEKKKEVVSDKNAEETTTKPKKKKLKEEVAALGDEIKKKVKTDSNGTEETVKVKTESADGETKKSKAKEEPTVAITNTSCTTVATEKDFFKIRRNMASRITDEEMIEEAKKFFRKECFSTDQLRNLSALFLTSAGKYQFFDAAYPYVADKENFKTLEAEIKDAYYLKRFKALIGE